MMATFVITLFVFAILMAGMAVGMVKGRSLAGSCGGTGESCECSPIKRRRCEQKQAAEGVVADDGNHHLDVLPDDSELR